MSAIKDINLAPSGAHKIDWVRKNCPLLRSLEDDFSKERPFEGIRIALSIHLEAKTAYLCKVLAAGGAEMYITGSNPLSTQDDVAAALVADGLNVYAWYDCTPEEYDQHITSVLENNCNIIIDDGGDLVHMLHTKMQDKLQYVIGGCEETTTGIIRLIAMAKNKPEMNQVEMHPYLQQNELFQFCQSEGIYLTAYSPLGRNLPIKNKPGLTNEPIIINLAKKYNCTPAQIIIAWGVQRGIMIIPKSVHPERIKENIKSLDINISPEDMTQIATLDSHTRMTDGSAWIFPNGPYTMKNIWDEK